MKTAATKDASTRSFWAFWMPKTGRESQGSRLGRVLEKMVIYFSVLPDQLRVDTHQAPSNLPTVASSWRLRKGQGVEATAAQRDSVLSSFSVTRPTAREDMLDAAC